MKNIEWSSDDDLNNEQNNRPNENPWDRPRKPAYQDLILKEEFQSRRLRFETGQTWLRILPALSTSAFGWMLGVYSLGFGNGQYAHPKTLNPNARSAFDHAYRWARENHPQALYSKANKDGIRLLTNPVCVFWALVESNGKFVARVFQGSGYDGSRGGAPGLGHQIWRLTQEVDEGGSLTAEPVHPDRGVLVCVEKTQPKGSKYPSYNLRVGRQPAPMIEVIQKVESEDLVNLCPLEQVIRPVSDEEEWAFLSRIMAAEHITALRTSLKDA
jgi:hypothetical protein